MMDYKAMTTPLASNLKLLSDASSDSVDATKYHQMIGSLMYLTNMRPDIFFAMNTLSQFLTDLRHVHLRRTVDYELKYEANRNINLEGYVDSNWVGSAMPLIGRALQDVI